MIIVNATLPAKEDKKEEIIKKAEELINASRSHDGNISYNLVRDTLDDSLTFIEKWETKEALEAHMKTEEFIAFGESIKDDLTDELSITVYLGEVVTEN